tara:strand:- start:323 stop:565 length:243 start_codon:yes stop_codon:yes gene_type:complete
MNSRRLINNVTPKDGFNNMFDLTYTWNKDSRGNDICSTLTDSFMVKGDDLIFESEKSFKKVCRILGLSKKGLIEELKSRI